MRRLLFILGICMGCSLGELQSFEHLPTKENMFENSLRSKVLIKGEPNNKMNILKRMEHYKVPGVSVAIVNNGQIDWAKGYGHLSNEPNSKMVDEHTLFQAGSISKSFTAFGALLLVQQGKISLDEDVNVYLKRWKVPENEFTKTEKVTLRRLLSHTAGTNVSGFPGYSIDSSIPSIIDILDGKKTIVNTEPIRVIAKPGKKFNYSGGGTTIVQLLIEDITGERFDVWMEKNVLKPLGMIESTFKQPLPPSYAINAASGYYKEGQPVKGKWHIYPEMAAAGLWSTPTDLAKFILYIQQALKTEESKPLKAAFIKEMITRQKADHKDTDLGLGLLIKGHGQNLVFEHNGQDEGFIADLYGFAFRPYGIVIMMNNDSGWILMNEILNSAADVYNWPNFSPIIKEKITIAPSTFTHFIGHYIHEEEEIEISNKEDQLFLNIKNGTGPSKLYPSSACTFFVQSENISLEFSNCDRENESLIFLDSQQVKTVYKKK